MTEKSKGVLALIALTFVWSLQGMLPRYLSISLPLFQQVYLRFVLGAVFIAVIFHRQINWKRTLVISWRDLWPMLARVISYYLLGVTLFTKAIILTTISNVSFINALPFTALLGWLIFREKFNLKKLALVILAFIGAILILVKDWSTISSFGLGELLALISAFFVALGMLFRKWETPRLNTIESSLVVLFFAAVFVFFAAIISGEGLPAIHWHQGLTLALIAAGLFNAAIVSLITYGFSRVKAVLANNLLQLEVPLTVFLAFLIYHEIPVL
ncbi:MAG: DMT family transporter, partial [Patescibacteria group bacterium]|nr:DMT family transporter [Patescibacteria group bacterium]